MFATTRRLLAGDRTGFSLVEILVAMAVMVIGILGVVPMLAFNIKANVSGKNYGTANYLAQQKLEQIRSWPLYEDYGTQRGITQNNGLLFLSENLKVGEHHQTFTRTSEVVRNGHDYMGPGTNDGDGLKFVAAEIDEGTIVGGGSMNTGNVGEKSGSAYRGEDFKLIRVTVSWYDRSFGATSAERQHEIVRHMFLAAF